jgi:hypothetical protein
MNSERPGCIVFALGLLGAFGVLSGLAWRSVQRATRELERLSPSTTAPAALKPGEPARYQGRLEPGSEPQTGLVYPTPCVARHTRVTALAGCNDEGCARRDVILDERRGPPFLLVRGEHGHVALALAHWNDVKGKHGRYRVVEHLPRLATPSLKRPRFSPSEYLVEESHLVAGQPLFVAGVAGRLWDAAAPEGDAPSRTARAPVREILRDPALGRVELFRGRQEDLLGELRSTKRWNTVWGVAAGIPALLGFVLLAIGVVSVIRER